MIFWFQFVDCDMFTVDCTESHPKAEQTFEAVVGIEKTGEAIIVSELHA